MKILINVELRRTHGLPSGAQVVGEDLIRHIPKTLSFYESSYIVENIEYKALLREEVIAPVTQEEIARLVSDFHNNGSMYPSLMTYIQAIERAGFKIVRD